MRIRRKILLSVVAAALLTLIIGGGWGLLHFEIQQIKQELGRYNRSLSDELENQQSTLKKIGLNQTILFESVNESRAALELPPAESISLQPQNQADSTGTARSSDADNDDVLFFDGINYLDSYYQSKVTERSFAAFLQDEKFAHGLRKTGLQLQEINEQRYSLKNGEMRLFILDAVPGEPDPQLKITSRLQNEELLPLDESEQTISASVRFIQTELKKIRDRKSVV